MHGSFKSCVVQTDMTHQRDLYHSQKRPIWHIKETYNGEYPQCMSHSNRVSNKSLWPRIIFTSEVLTNAWNKCAQTYISKYMTDSHIGSHIDLLMTWLIHIGCHVDLSNTWLIRIVCHVDLLNTWLIHIGCHLDFLWLSNVTCIWHTYDIHKYVIYKSELNKGDLYGRQKRHTCVWLV